MAALAPKPSATAAATACFRPASSRTLKKGASIASTPPSAQAATRRLLAPNSGSHAVAAAKSAAISAAPNIKLWRRGVAVEIVSTAANPLALSINPTRRAVLPDRVSKRSRMRRCAADSVFGRTTKSGVAGEASRADRSVSPTAVSRALIRNARAIPPSPGMARYLSAVARAPSLSAGATASSRSIMRTSAPASSAFAKRSGRVPGVKSQPRVWLSI
jgi:hypothetical protein